MAHFSAVVERRLRDLHPDELDPEGAGLIHLPHEYLEVLQAWNPRDLPPNLADISEEEAVAYVERHFMLLGMPVSKVEQARRCLSVNDLDVAELDFVEPARQATASGPPVAGARQ
jgi:type IV secretion system protein VirD4